ncbi:glycosyltransferase [Paenibacillus sp. MMS20-IR301]|uniref:glycosyltransferase n=1 Tax=Paenibacillus sp. MMS20-IR301 TaxID=2895946 RepID=UPI0028EBA710|nr:glycosyltransferase [Paenibacillus sp. MMS20-IR301]WNS43584.1 glycosyltransferase [Paenibacillus sp. MMS20-IR301]
MRERMLFLSAQSHYPEDIEGEIRTENFLDILLQRFDIDLLEYCHCRKDLPAQPRPELTVHRVKRAMAPRRPMLVPLNKLRSYSPLVRTDKTLRAELTEKCRLNAYTHVFISYCMLGNCLDVVASLLPEAVIITDAHRYGSRTLESRTAGKRGISNGYHKLGAALMRREERRLMNKTSLLLTATEWDALSFKAVSFADAGKVHVVPPYINLNEPKYNAAEIAPRDHSVVLHWNMHTSQGKSAALLFLKKVYPLVKAAVPDFVCRIISDKVHPEIAALAGPDAAIELVAGAGQTAEYIRRASAVVTSLRDGCGGVIKILEAWALRTPVVCGPRGAEDLICEPGRDILLAGTTAGFADELVKLLMAPELGSIIADQAYRTLEKHYSADGVKEKVLSLV